MPVCLGVSQLQLVHRRLVPTKGLTLMMRTVWSSDDVGPDGIDDGVGCDDLTQAMVFREKCENRLLYLCLWSVPDKNVQEIKIR
ncbi:hypothetical protein HanHA300_Chr14g0537041 [Helianthus annuus]|nr:hypothetical protein HanHA300_Chr14g0537041 [Helianthus annuus]KAJ0486925.1 hypothetical protein HanHA89_Chr14g0584901 [Helianthus annuus]